MCGTRAACATLPHAGCARTAAIGYAKNGIVISTNTRSAALYDPRTTSSQTTAAAIGTERYFGTCASERAAPIPTNSLMQMPRFAISTESVENDDQRTPY